MRPKTIIFLAVIALCFASCGRSFSLAERFLDEAEAKLETQPDSAFVELDSLDRSLLGTKELRARHALLYTIALEKVGMEITSDSIINIAVDYYSTSGDEAMKEKALYYKNIINQNAASVHKDTLALQRQKIIEERYTGEKSDNLAAGRERNVRQQDGSGARFRGCCRKAVQKNPPRADG